VKLVYHYFKSNLKWTRYW